MAHRVAASSMLVSLAKIILETCDSAAAVMSELAAIRATLVRTLT
jgi:hypothetical protein